MAILLKVEEARIYFPIRKGVLRHKVGDFKAVDGVSFQVEEGEVFGIVGESGSGKTTLARAIAGLIPLTSGRIEFFGDRVLDLQIIFQNPYASLNPRRTIGESLIEPLEYHGRGGGREKGIELLRTVGLSPEIMDRYPHQISWGQQQRVCIGRAISMEPKLLICDEAVSALDVSVQAQILNLLMELKEKFNLSYLFISHDLSVIRHICDRVMVMKGGEAVEKGEVEAVLNDPQNPYTKKLVSSIPKLL